MAKGWQFNGVATAQTGNVTTIQTPSNLANTGQTADRPNSTGVNDPNFVSTPTNWFNRAAYWLNAPFTIGTLGRNTMRGPGAYSIDFSAFKEFKLRENYTLQFRAEGFNVLNHPNLGMPNNVFNASPTSSFGVIGDTGNYLARNIQFALKLLF